jgi:carbamate kinase
LTSVDQVAINFGKPDQTPLGELPVSEIRKYVDQGHFPAGSMGPKVEAAIDFIENGGRQVLITSFDKATEALAGKAGTRIHPDLELDS